MKKQLSCLSIAVLSGLTIVAPVAAQTVTNPNFDPPAEDASDNPSPGYGPISGWTTSAAGVGVNPSATGTTQFLNGLAPHGGTHVGFMQNTRMASQSVSGYNPAKLYTVTYFVNERGTAAGTATSTSVSLDGGATSYAQPDNIRRTGKFRRIVSGPLAVSGASSNLVIRSAGVSGDNSLLVDTVSISRAVPRVPDNGLENPVQPGPGAVELYRLALGPSEGSGTLAGSLWTFGGKGGIARNGSSYTGTGEPQSPEGSQTAMLVSNNSSFSTSVSGFEAGVTYSLSFAAAGRAGTGLGPNTIRVLLNGSPLLFGGNTTLTPAVSASTYTTYTTDEFTTLGGSFTLAFEGLTPGDKTSFIDDIRFNFIAEASTPSGPLKITSITKSGNTFTVEFEGVDGGSYDLNKSTTLDFTTPDIKDTVTLSGTSNGTLEDTTATEDKAFYRVEQQP